MLGVHRHVRACTHMRTHMHTHKYTRTKHACTHMDARTHMHARTHTAWFCVGCVYEACERDGRPSSDSNNNITRGKLPKGLGETQDKGRNPDTRAGKRAGERDGVAPGAGREDSELLPFRLGWSSGPSSEQKAEWRWAAAGHGEGQGLGPWL